MKGLLCDAVQKHRSIAGVNVGEFPVMLNTPYACIPYVSASKVLKQCVLDVNGYCRQS